MWAGHKPPGGLQIQEPIHLWPLFRGLLRGHSYSRVVRGLTPGAPQQTLLASLARQILQPVQAFSLAGGRRCNCWITLPLAVAVVLVVTAVLVVTCLWGVGRASR